MSKRIPAHEVIVKMIDETVESLLISLNDPHPNCDKPEAESILVITKVAIISGFLTALDGMIMSEDELNQVQNTLFRIRVKLPDEYAGKLLPEKHILEVTTL